jgi:putative acetyltransferase
MHIRRERQQDFATIRTVTQAAFRDAPHTSHTEAAIVDALRAANALTISLVADVDGEVVAHVAFSPVTINDKQIGWYGLGPVSVRPDHQRKGLGQALIREGLAQLRQQGARGCVVLGEPEYYGRFGFRSGSNLRLAGVPPEYFQYLTLTEPTPQGQVAYHSGFDAA